jgi:hypothetical protein
LVGKITVHCFDKQLYGTVMCLYIPKIILKGKNSEEQPSIKIRVKIQTKMRKTQKGICGIKLSLKTQSIVKIHL